MEILPSLRAIRQRRLLLAGRILVATGGILIALAGLVALGRTKSITTSTAVAWTTIALDTPESQLVAVAPPGADTLGWRASLLTHLMTTDNSVQELAGRLGVRADQVAVVDPALATPIVPTAMAQAAAKVASSSVAPYALTALVENQSLPVISIEAAAPDRLGARRLANAAIAVLESQASAGGKFSSPIATGGKDFSRQPFIIEQVAPVRVKLLAASAPPIKAIGGALFVLASCTCALFLPRLSHAIWARRAALPA
jgi:hypothetical protein